MENESKGNNLEQMFSGGGDRNAAFREKEWYKEKIVDMINHISNEDYLFKIYHYVFAKYRRDKK